MGLANTILFPHSSRRERCCYFRLTMLKGSGGSVRSRHHANTWNTRWGPLPRPHVGVRVRGENAAPFKPSRTSGSTWRCAPRIHKTGSMHNCGKDQSIVIFIFSNECFQGTPPERGAQGREEGQAMETC